MKTFVMALLLASTVAACSKPADTSNGAVNADQNRPAAAPAAGNNSFTEEQAKGHLANAGYTNITNMTQDAQGVWHGQAMKGGKSAPVSVDYQGSDHPRAIAPPATKFKETKMTRTITRLFDTRVQAESTVRELETMGIPESELSIVAGRSSTEDTQAFARGDHDGDNDTAKGAGKGVLTGGVLGGGAGLLAGLGLLAIPGIGPVVAAGWLASTALGAAVGATAGGATGGLLGALKDSGVSDGDAHVYAEGVRRGGTLVSARVEEADAARVEAVLQRQSGVDAATRGPLYRQSGWTAFDEQAAPYRDPTIANQI